MFQGAPFRVQAKMRVALVDLLIAMPADLPPHIRRDISVGQLAHKGVAQRMKPKRLELTPLALFLPAALREDARCSHDTLKQPGKPTVAAGSLRRQSRAKPVHRIITAWQREQMLLQFRHQWHLQLTRQMLAPIRPARFTAVGLAREISN